MNKDIEHLLSPAAIREQAQRLFDYTQAGKGHFTYHPEKFDETVTYVLHVIRKNYPDLRIPFHSRWGHFRVGGIDRVQEVKKLLVSESPLERARSLLDLVITSVLLDAGAGAEWSYFEASTHKKFSRSEGLGVASLRMFLTHAFSSDKNKYRADGEALKRISVHNLEKAFQVSSSNPLLGVEGRVSLLQNLGRALENDTIFKDDRPGNILDYLSQKCGKEIPAPEILRAVLDGLGPIWPGRISMDGVNLGDVWAHSLLAPMESLKALVPFHKLSQWLTYSLIEPIEEAGFKVTEVEKLTGLAEYRNGGLMIDSGLIRLKDPNSSSVSWPPDSDLVIEWRALTIYLLDKIGEAVQRALNKSPQEFPLAKVLEGGTWWAGRFLAQEKRPNGNPPLTIKSDGTVF